MIFIKKLFWSENQVAKETYFSEYILENPILHT